MSTTATISSVLQLPEVFPEFKKIVFKSHTDGKTVSREMMSQFITPRPTEEGWFEKFAEALAHQATINAEVVLSAAVIVLAHSNADDAFTSACQIAIGLDPESWIGELNQDRLVVSLGDLRKKNVSEVFASHLERLSAGIGQKSILSRSDLLFKHVPFRKHPDIASDENAYYKREKLEEADKLRHEIVHGSGLPRIPIAKATATVEFLNEAATTDGTKRWVPLQFADRHEVSGRALWLWWKTVRISRLTVPNFVPTSIPDQLRQNAMLRPESLVQSVI